MGWQVAASDFSNLSCQETLEKEEELSGQEDLTYGGFGSAWQAMLSVLDDKFGAATLSFALDKSGETFLLDHSSGSGGDPLWSDNGDGEGTNWFGLQLMLIRDMRRGHRGQWTEYVLSLMDTVSGKFNGPNEEKVWQDAVRNATRALATKVADTNPLSFIHNLQDLTTKPGPGICIEEDCGRLTWNGWPGECCEFHRATKCIAAGCRRQVQAGETYCNRCDRKLLQGPEVIKTLAGAGRGIEIDRRTNNNV